jgi:RNA polymerase-binding transcription factor DksA
LPARPQSASAHTTVAPSKQATPVRGAEKKPGIIVAHRRLENKSKKKDDAGKTMINYQPEYNRSILDEPEQMQGPVYRYSDEELNEFRELIQARLEKARKELTYQQGLITRKDEAGTEDTENRYMNMEDGSGAMEREQLAQLASRQIQFINHLEKALMRIENKTYGICRVTGKLIDKARLRAVPHATLSIEAKMMGSK